MEYKEFVRWCNKRACDGKWNMQLSLTCINIMKEIKSLPFWQREKTWHKINNRLHLEKLLEEYDTSNSNNKKCEWCGVDLILGKFAYNQKICWDCFEQRINYITSKIQIPQDRDMVLYLLTVTKQRI